MKSKIRPKIATSVAHPESNVDLFEEGWGDALAREEETREQVLLYPPSQAPNRPQSCSGEASHLRQTVDMEDGMLVNTA